MATPLKEEDLLFLKYNLNLPFRDYELGNQKVLATGAGVFAGSPLVERLV